MPPRRAALRSSAVDPTLASDALLGVRSVIEAMLAAGAGGRIEIVTAGLERLRAVLGVEVAAALLLDPTGRHIERFTSLTRVRVRFVHHDLDRRLPPAIETAAFRIVQEALTNVARHAAGASAEVELRCEHHQLRLRIEDNGAGFSGPTRPASMGLSGMRERARLVGGHLRVISVRGAGVQVRATRPLRPAGPS